VLNPPLNLVCYPANMRHEANRCQPKPSAVAISFRRDRQRKAIYRLVANQPNVIEFHQVYPAMARFPVWKM
jgi:hypothetical protein